MADSRNHILFISHKANRTGASMLLLEIVREFKKQSGLPFKIILMENGPLAEEFKLLAPTYIWEPPQVKLFGKGLLNPVNKFVSRILMILKAFWIFYCIRKTTLAFSNTITNGHLHKKLLWLKCKFITYVHELEISIKALTNQQTLQTVLQHSQLILAGSHAVKNNLMEKHNVPVKSIHVIYSSLPELERERKFYLEEHILLKHRLNIPAEAVIFGAAGENEWRKGFDLFAPLAKLYFNLYPNSKAHFIWMGVKPNSMNYFNDMHDVEKFHINDRLHFIVHGSEYLKNMAVFDTHLLLSREDPYPLVVLDAATLGIPTICFANAGGSPEFVEEDCGFCIPYGDLYYAAKAINQLETDAMLRNNLGQNARKKVKERHDQSIATNKIIQLINETL